MTKEIEESPGNISSMRVTLRATRRVGIFMIISGVILAAAILILNSRFELLPFAIILVTTGPAMITGISYAKSMQTKNESAEVI